MRFFFFRSFVRGRKPSRLSSQQHHQHTGFRPPNARTCAGSAPVEERAQATAAVAPLARAEGRSAGGGRLRRRREEDEADATTAGTLKKRGLERGALLGCAAGFEDALRVLCIQWRGSMAGPFGEIEWCCLWGRGKGKRAARAEVGSRRFDWRVIFPFSRPRREKKRLDLLCSSELSFESDTACRGRNLSSLLFAAAASRLERCPPCAQARAKTAEQQQKQEQLQR